MSKVKFQNSPSPFFDTLKKKVELYFSENQIAKKTGNRRLFTKTYILVAQLVITYFLILFLPVADVWKYLLFVLQGLTLAGIGFNVMHDGAHGSYSSRKWVNNLMGHSLDFIGGSTFFWKTKHNIIHHTYTNIDGMDEDIDIPFMRTTEEQEKKWYHKYQHIYGPMLYCLQYLFWVFYSDFKKYFTGKIGGIKYPKMKTKDHIIFWVSKAVSITVFFAIPVIVLGWWLGLTGLLLMCITTGITISIVFQMAHLVEHREFPVPDPTSNKIENEWAIHQVHTTANFATKSKLADFLLGGLNFQVEHHLFPRISHVHYKNLNKIVKETCQEFNLHYGEYPSLPAAIRSHLRFLRQMGTA